MSFYGKGERTLYFHGHYDVVPATNAAQFHPYVKDGNLFGRGSSDMKSGLAAMIYAVKAIKDCGIELNGRIGLTIVPDEETGGAGGSSYLADAGLLGKGGIGMLTPEPTSGVIWNANRGAISLRVTVKGKPAHVGLHYQGVNAFERMLVVANALLELKTEVESRTTEFKIEPEAARRSILLMGGRCEGGSNFNLVPAECSFTVDRRINPEEDFETEKRRLLVLIDKLRQGGIDIAVDIFQEGRAAGFSEDGPVAQALVECVQTITGKTPSFEMCPGLLETRFYAQQGIPAFAYGPGLLSVSHGPNEFVKLKDIHACTAIYALTAARLLA
jgi:acetylornithine deacetylase/succinyl-diaminopimelate desuccinylase family protein